MVLVDQWHQLHLECLEPLLSLQDLADRWRQLHLECLEHLPHPEVLVVLVILVVLEFLANRQVLEVLEDLEVLQVLEEDYYYFENLMFALEFQCSSNIFWLSNE